MPAGMEVYGDHGLLQITDQWCSVGFRGKYDGLFLGGYGQWWGSEYGRATVDVVAITPIIAVYSSFPVGIRAVYGIGTNTWRVELNCPSGYAGSRCEVFVFDQQVASGTTSGFQVFRADGSLAFDSGVQYARIRGMARRPANTPTFQGTPWSYTGLPSAKYAVCFSSRSGITPIPNTTTFYTMDMATSLSNGAQIQLLAYGTKQIWDEGDGYSQHLDTVYSSDVLIIDVSLI